MNAVDPTDIPTLQQIKPFADAAAQSASDADDAKDAAVQAKTDTEALYDDFVSRYLGPYASDPTVDPNGDALTQGALYFNTVGKHLRMYDGTNWIIFENITFASQATAETGTDNTSAMTPLRTSQHLAARRGVANGIAAIGSDGFVEKAPAKRLISTVTVSTAVASVEFTGLDLTKYAAFVIECESVKMTATGQVRLQFGAAGPTYVTTGYIGGAMRYGNVTIISVGSGLPLESAAATNAGLRWSCIRLSGLASGEASIAVIDSYENQNNTGTFGSMFETSGTAHPAVRFLPSAGNIDTGSKFRLYGVPAWRSLDGQGGGR